MVELCPISGVRRCHGSTSSNGFVSMYSDGSELGLSKKS